jgi:hypothetical protein
MAVSAKLYPAFQKSLMNKEIDLDSDVIKAVLLSSAYTFSAAHQYKSSLTNELATLGGYTVGGVTVGSPVLSLAAQVATFDAADITWTADATGFGPARYCVLYDSTPATDANPVYLGYNDEKRLFFVQRLVNIGAVTQAQTVKMTINDLMYLSYAYQCIEAGLVDNLAAARKFTLSDLMYKYFSGWPY